MSNFQDFIPDGGDNTAYKNGFNDFQPTPAPVAEVAPVTEEVASPTDTPVVVVLTRKDLDAKAAALGIDTSKMKSKAKVEEAIKAKESEGAEVPAETTEEVAEPVVETPVETTPKEEVVAAVPVEPVAETVTEPVVESAPVAEVAPEA